MERPSITPPIIVSEGGDTDIFETIEAAERYLEPYDIEILTAYDSQGRLLTLLPTSPRITIESAELTPSHARNLRQVLLRFLKDVGDTADDLPQWTLDHLVALALKYKTE